MNISVEKFGGASVNSSAAIKNVVKILTTEHKKRIVVVSAMGKTTNALERIINGFVATHNLNTEAFNELEQYHQKIIEELFETDSKKDFLKSLFEHLIRQIFDTKTDNYDFFYDQIVSFGEIISTTIISQYLNSINIKHKFLIAKDIIKTDKTFRNATVNWEATTKCVNEIIVPSLKDTDLVLIQGFIGGTENEDFFTTLGREGSDYTAAILSYCLDAKRCTIWKDVTGLLNADPKRMQNTIKIDTLPYSEAIELAYYGATIIHPKTIKPLENKNIPLYVRSFLNPDEIGSVIDSSFSDSNSLSPCYIFKDNQVLLSIFPRDFSFIAEENISNIFAILAKWKIKVNLMQNSAISFSLCFDFFENIDGLINDLKQDYRVRYNSNLQLITIRHYTAAAIENVVCSRPVLLEQRSRTTVQILLKVKK